MIAIEKTISTQNIFSGRVLEFRVDTVELPDGSLATRELVHHPGGVAVVPVDDDGYVYLVRQWRKPYEEAVLEIPAGKRDKGEEPHASAVRELGEETGLVAEKYTDLGSFYPSPGYVDEVIYLYLATGLKKGEAHPDDDEYVETEKIHIDTLVDMIMNNEIKDGKTIAAVLKAKMFLDN